MAAMNAMLAARTQPTTIGHTSKQTDEQTGRQDHNLNIFRMYLVTIM